MAFDSRNALKPVSPAIERIKRAMEEKGFNQRTLSEALVNNFGKEGGLSTGGISLLFRGEIKFKEKHAEMFSKVLNIDLRELRSLINLPMNQDDQSLIAHKDSLRFLFRKANGNIGSIPPPPLPDEAADKAAESYAAFYRKLEELGFEML